MDDESALTWAFLLGKWTELARASAAFARTSEGERQRAAVAPVITLSAVTHALGEADRLDESERALGHDRAEILIRQCASELHALWRGEHLPDKLGEFLDDARGALARSRSRGVLWRAGAGGFVAFDHAPLRDALTQAGFTGECWCALGGERYDEGTPVGFARARVGGAPARAIVELVSTHLGPHATGPEPAPDMPQVYRTAGEPDRVLDLGAGIEAGRPMLVRVG